MAYSNRSGFFPLFFFVEQAILTRKCAQIADQVKDVWGFDEEGELRTMWRRTGHPGYWFFGGNLALCRYYSRMLALQIKAMEEGIMKYEDP